MLTVYPEDYPRFRCLAGDCRHTCCAGWEIDIDPDALTLYARTEGILGQRLAAAIQREPTPHFRLDAGARCPFLNARNLCDLILAGGEGMLCQICRDHPRYRSFLPGRTEIGVGLCCEAAAAQLLARTAPMRLIAAGETEEADPEAETLVRLRDELLSLAQDRTRPLPRRMEDILAACGAEDSGIDLAQWAAFYLRLERLDEGWTPLLTQLRDEFDKVDITQFRRHMAGRETEYEQLLSYFLHRHFLKAYDDGDVTSKASFAVLSVRLLEALGALHYGTRGDFTRADQAELARIYSGEIEYSEDNLDALFDALYTGPWNG